MGDESRPSGAVRHGAIDQLRAVAVLLVINDHWQDRYADFGATSSVLQVVLDYCGWVGVDLFFVISGFLVSGLLFSEYRRAGTVSAGRFLIRRGFKIYPAFYALLATFVVKRALDGELRWGRIAAEAGFVQNYFEGMFLHTWSLAVEEHFYIGLAILVVVLARRGILDRPTLVTSLILAGIVGILAMRVINGLAAPRLGVYSARFPLGSQYFATHLRMDGLLLGVLLSFQYHFNRERTLAYWRRWQSPLVVCGLALVLVTAPWLNVKGITLKPSNHFWLGTLGFTCLYCGWSGVLMAAMVKGGSASKQPWSRALCHIGQRSYSIYLWHLLVASLLMRLIRGTSFEALPHLAMAVYTLAAVGFGCLVADLIEIPMLRVRDRLFPGMTPNAARPIAATPTGCSG